MSGEERALHIGADRLLKADDAWKRGLSVTKALREIGPKFRLDASWLIPGCQESTERFGCRRGCGRLGRRGHGTTVCRVARSREPGDCSGNEG